MKEENKNSFKLNKKSDAFRMRQKKASTKNESETEMHKGMHHQGKI